MHLLTCDEGVLDRHESLAANLGAKLTGPRLLKGIEKFFDGPIKTNSPLPFANPLTWLDVVSFAKANPSDFVLTAQPDGIRCCRFTCKGVRTEITEDDWRLISSGALDRFPLEHPFEEDETAELATLDILEQRASILYKKADEVAARARILHHKLGHRKSDVARRRKGHDGGSGRFHAANHHPPRSAGFSPSYDLHADLLQQFLSPSSSMPSRSTSGAAVSVATLGPLSPSINPPRHHRLSGQSGRSSAGNATDPGTPTAADGQGEVYRSLITQSTDKLARGDVINPPCDRCRRLRLQCVKHLTACQGCTKKHAKCSWKSVAEEEIARLKLEMGVEGEPEGEQQGGLPGLPEARIARTGDTTPGTSNAEGASRPASQADTDLGLPRVYSPDPLSMGRPEGGQDTRQSYPPQGPAGIPPTREQSRLSQISSILDNSDHGRPPAQGASSNPPSR